MNTKQAKDFLVEQTVEQATLEEVPLTDIEKKMMYFTESDATSCDNPIELNEEFEAHYEMGEYEAKISRLLHQAYKRLKGEDPERMRNWDQAIRVLRKGDHYFLVLWDTKPPSEHPTRDFFKLLGVGLLVSVAIIMALVSAAKYNLDLNRYGKYSMILIVGLFLLVTGGFRPIYRLLLVWFHREAKQDEAPH